MSSFGQQPAQQAPGQLSADQAYTQAMRLIKAGRLRQAGGITVQLLRHFAEHPPALMAHAMVARRLGLPDTAKNLLTRGIEATTEPGPRSAMQRELAWACVLTMDAEGADAAIDAAIEGLPESKPQALATRIWLRLMQGKPEEAKKIVGENADLLESAGFATAAAQVPGVDAGPIKAKLIEHSKAVGGSAMQLAETLRSLAALHEQAGEHAEAFRCWERAAKMGAETYKPNQTAEFVRTVRKDWTEKALAKVKQAEAGEPRPVFVFGLPGSGLSLVEDHLVRLSGVSAAAPVGSAERAASRFIPKQDDAFRPVFHAPAKLRGADLSKAARAYPQLAIIEDPSASVIVDRSPFNVFNAGLLALMFPNAVMVWCRRDPIDACLSCFANHAGPVHPYAQDLGTLAHMSRGIEHLGEHWSAALPATTGVSWHEVVYEDVCRGELGTLEGVVKACGLDGAEPQDAGDRVILSPHAGRVRAERSEASIGRSEHYRKRLAPLIETLDSL